MKIRINIEKYKAVIGLALIVLFSFGIYHYQVVSKQTTVIQQQAETISSLNDSLRDRKDTIIEFQENQTRLRSQIEDLEDEVESLQNRPIVRAEIDSWYEQSNNVEVFDVFLINYGRSTAENLVIGCGVTNGSGNSEFVETFTADVGNLASGQSRVESVEYDVSDSTGTQYAECYLTRCSDCLNIEDRIASYSDRIEELRNSPTGTTEVNSDSSGF